MLSITEFMYQEEDGQSEDEKSRKNDRKIENEDNSEDDNQVADEHGLEDGEQIEDEDEDDPELVKRLNKQRRRAIQAAHGGRRNFTSRNTYKDKGGRSSHNSKIQKQLSNW